MNRQISVVYFSSSLATITLLMLTAPRPAHSQTNLLAPSTAPGSVLGTNQTDEIATVQAIAQRYRGLTAQAVRSKYQVLQETNEVPWILDVKAEDNRTADQLTFSFERGALYQVILRGTNGNICQIFFNKDSSLVSYSDWSKSISYYTNGQLKSVEHYGPYPLWLGHIEFHSQTGDLLMYTNYTKPTAPQLPEQLRWHDASPPRIVQ